MGSTQTSFLNDFTAAFRAPSGIEVTWSGGQARHNTTALPFNGNVRRNGKMRHGERFELGDLTGNIGECRIVVEFDGAVVLMNNLLKYWPYVRGETSTRPTERLVICHFSNWWSYASHRDLWEWTLLQIKQDPRKVVDVHGRQFDHWGKDKEGPGRRSQSIISAVDWILDVSGLAAPARANA